MEPIRDHMWRRKERKEPVQITNDGFVGYLLLVCMGMALGFVMGYGLLYT